MAEQALSTSRLSRDAEAATTPVAESATESPVAAEIVDEPQTVEQLSFDELIGAAAAEADPVEAEPVVSQPAGEGSAVAEPIVETEPVVETTFVVESESAIEAEPVVEAEPVANIERLFESADETPSPESIPTATDSFEAIIAGAFPTDASSEAPEEGPAEEPASSDTTNDEPEPTATETKRERRARHRASSDAPVDRPRAPRSIRRIAARTMSVSALLAVGLMTVATSIPANALLSADDVQQQKRQAHAQAQYGTDSTQSMVNTASADTSVHRDTYGALSATEAAVQLGIKPESTFTNDPNGTVQWPFSVGVHIGSGYGPRAGCSLGCSTNHLGQDFNPGYGAPIQSIADGVVVESTDSGGGFGVKIVIEHVIDGQMIHSLYGHMIPGSRTVQVGDHVSVGQIIGKTGNTGISTGPHMHFEILINGTEHVDPLAWLYENTN